MMALRGKALVAYLLVCVFWGSTYLAIRVGVAELPPFLFAGTRFLVAGALLLALSLARGETLPRDWPSWRTQAVVGLFTLLGGNTCVVWAEQFTDSGVASIFVVTVALWLALFDALVPGGSGRVSARVLTGLAIGFAGTVLLIGAHPRDVLTADLRGPAALTLASASWAFGSVWFKRRPGQVSSPYIAASLQMLVGGAAVTLLGLLLGDASRWHASPTGIGALAYLIVFGSIVGYTSYFYALRHAPPTIVGTYAYVNPVIAVLLGHLILDEPVGPRTLLAMVLILGAVAWIQTARVPPAPHTTAAARASGVTGSHPDRATKP